MSDALAAYDRAMARLAEQHEPFKVTLPEGESGAWKVVRFEVKNDIEAMRCWRDGRPVPPGMYTRLSGPQGLFMSDTPAELNDARCLFGSAFGSVLITGLGLGMIPLALLRIRSIEHITILELEQDVINLVGPSMTDPRIRVVHADAFAWQPDRGFDWAWHDIWPDMNEDNLPEMARLRRRYGKFMSGHQRQLCWGEDVIRRDMRRWG